MADDSSLNYLISDRTERRKVLAGAGLFITGIAGCVEEATDQDPTSEGENEQENNDEQGELPEEEEEKEEEDDSLDDLPEWEQELASKAMDILEETMWATLEYPTQSSEYEDLLLDADGQLQDLKSHAENQAFDEITEADLTNVVESRQNVLDFLTDDPDVYAHYVQSDPAVFSDKNELDELVEDLIRYKELGEQENFFELLDEFIEEAELVADPSFDEDHMSYEAFSFDSPPLNRPETVTGGDRYVKEDESVVGNLVVNAHVAETGETRTHGYEYAKHHYDLQYVEIYEEGQLTGDQHFREPGGNWDRSEYDKYDPAIDILPSNEQKVFFAVAEVDGLDKTVLESGPGHFLMAYDSKEEAEEAYEQLLSQVDTDPDDNDGSVGAVEESDRILWEYEEDNIYAYSAQFWKYIVVFGADTVVWEDQSDGVSWLFD